MENNIIIKRIPNIRKPNFDIKRTLIYQAYTQNPDMTIQEFTSLYTTPRTCTTCSHFSIYYDPDTNFPEHYCSHFNISNFNTTNNCPHHNKLN